MFLSSESKSGSELNSSLEYPEQASPDNGQPTELKNVKGDFIDEVDWENYKKNKRASSLQSVLSAGQASPLTAHHNAKLHKTPQNKSAENGTTGSPRNYGEDFAYVKNFLRDQKQRAPSSPSVRTILTSATKDSNSIPASPHIPKIHNIHIRREGEQPARPRSALSTTTVCSETSIDLEVQNILGSQRERGGGSANESQEIIIDFDGSVASTANSSFELTAAELAGLKKAQTLNSRKKPRTAAASARSSADRSVGELSLYDQLCAKPASQRRDPRVEQYRNRVLAEIKAGVGQSPGRPRSRSESDLSDLAASPEPAGSQVTPCASEAGGGTSTSTTPCATPRTAPRPASPPSSPYSELTSSPGNFSLKIPSASN